MILNGIANDP
jgi:hypothetical protein